MNFIKYCKFSVKYWQKITGNELYIYVKERCMFSPEFMRYLINYQKSEFAPDNSKKEIKFKNPKSGKLAEIYAVINK